MEAMRRGLPVAALLACLATGGQALEGAGRSPSLFPIKVGEKWGYMDRSGSIRIEPRFGQARDFSEGLAAVDTAPDWKETGRWGFIDPEGRWAIEPRFEEARGFAEGFAVVKEGKSRFLVDKKGRKAAELRFAWANSLSQGRMRVSTGSLQGYADAEGKLVIPARFVDSGAFTKDGLAGVTLQDRRCGFIDRQGRFVVEPRFRDCGPFAEGMAAVGEDAGQGKTIFIDRKGRQAFPGRFDHARKFSEGLAAACQAGGCGFLDDRGRWAVPPAFERARDFSEGLAEVESGGLWGFCDRSGRLVIPAKFNDTVPFKNGLACVRLGRRLGYVDRSGRFVWHPLKGFAGEAAAALLALLSACLLPGVLAHWLGNRAWSSMRGAGSEAKVDILHRLAGRLSILHLVYALLFVAVSVSIGRYGGDTVSQGLSLVENRLMGLGDVPRYFCLLALVLGPAMALFFSGFILIQTAGFRADRLARGTRWSMAEAARANLRGLLIMLVPMVLWVLVVFLAGRWLPDNGYAIYGVLAVFLLAVFTFAPLWLRFLWSAKPLPKDGEVAGTLARLSERTGVRFSRVWVWKSSRARLANAMVSGILPFCRAVFLTDFLLKNFTPAEIEAIIGHEIGHIKKRHLWYYAAFSLSYGLATAGLFWVVERPAVSPHLPAPVLAFLSAVWYMGYFILLFGLLSRRFEIQADLYAAELTGGPRAISSALEKLGRLSGAPRRWSRLLEALSPHPSVSRRVAALGASPPRRSVPGSLALLLCALACCQGCEKAVERVRLDLFPSSGRGGKAHVPPRPPKPPCKGEACKGTEPPLGRMTAPMQAPPQSRPQPKDPPKAAGRKPKPFRIVPAKPKLSQASADRAGKSISVENEAQALHLEKAEHPDDEAAPKPDRYSVDKGGPGSRYISPAAVQGRKVEERPVGVKASAPQAAGAAPGAAMADVKEAVVEVSPLTETADLIGEVAEDPGDVGSTRVQIARTQDFKEVLLDRTYAFIEDADLYREFQSSGLKEGSYFIRFANIDLIDFQHPYTKPKKFRLRGVAAPAPKALRRP